MASRGIAAGLSIIGVIIPLVVLLDAADEARDPSMSSFEGLLRYAAVVGPGLVALVATYHFVNGRGRKGLAFFATSPLFLVWGGVLAALPHIVLTILIGACGVGWKALTERSSAEESVHG
ncbi:MAG TPA: hypothetical protein VEU29_01975 [Actinomycetota bacterium]|nr:hypothetical protein [Actinomycetota bacterium]